MPFSVYTMEGENILEMMSPPFRQVNFGQSELDQDRAMMTVTQITRDAWPLKPQKIPGFDLGDEDVATLEPGTVTTYFKRFIGPLSRLSPEARKQLLDDPDQTALHTPWRDAIYDTLCHVFVDAYPFLAQSGGEWNYGHYHHPEHEVFALSDGPTETRTWDRNVMLLPAYLAPGVTVKLFRAMPDGTTVEKGDFNHSEPFTTWWIRAGEKLELSFERKGEAGVLDGHAAVILVGPACNKHAVEHGALQGVEDEESEESKEEV